MSGVDWAGPLSWSLSPGLSATRLLAVWPFDPSLLGGICAELSVVVLESFLLFILCFVAARPVPNFVRFFFVFSSVVGVSDVFGLGDFNASAKVGLLPIFWDFMFVSGEDEGDSISWWLLFGVLMLVFMKLAIIVFLFLFLVFCFGILLAFIVR